MIFGVMNAVTGIYIARNQAEAAVATLRGLGIPAARITLLTPERGQDAVGRVPLTEAEPPGLGRTLGAVVGGAAGAAGGMQAGALLSIFVPGVGPVLVLGALGALLLGMGGAAAGQAFDEGLRAGLPKDEIYLYEDALLQGRSVVIALAEDADQAQVVRHELARAGAESIDAARERWWMGLRDAEAAAHVEAGDDFVRDEDAYRRGFEAALGIGREGRIYDEALGDLRARYPEIYDSEAFRRGYGRGLRWAAARRGQERAA